VEELTARIHDELGPDAIILRRREGLTGGLAGFFQRPFIELEAIPGAPRLDVYDDVSSAAPTPAPASPPFQTPAPAPAPAPAEQSQQAAPMPFYTREPPDLRLHGEYVTEQLAELARPRPLDRPAEPSLDPTRHVPGHVPGSHEVTARTAPVDASSDASSFSSVLDEAESMIQARSTIPDEPEPMHSEPMGSEPTDAEAMGSEATVGSSRSRPPGYSSQGTPASRGRTNIEKKLLGVGVSERFASELIDTAAIHVLPLTRHAGLAQAVQDGLAQQIPSCPPLAPAGAAIVLVGPGGAGKTSCCAALLRAYRESALLPVSCATLVRAPGRGELQMLLSPHIRKPTAVDTARAIRVLRKVRKEGLLIVDTPPLSPGDRSGIRKLAVLLGALEPERVVAVLPATLSAVAAVQLLEALRPLNANSLAITHADETDQIGVAVEAACRFELAPEYLLDRNRNGARRLHRIGPSAMAARLMK
jgi:flagellar biosynthesis GTPase FlhF